MPIYRKGEGQWTPEKQAGLTARAEGEAEGYYRREALPSSSIPPKQLQKDMEHERGWAIGMNPHIKASNVTGPVSGAAAGASSAITLPVNKDAIAAIAERAMIFFIE